MTVFTSKMWRKSVFKWKKKLNMYIPTLKHIYLSSLTVNVHSKYCNKYNTDFGYWQVTPKANDAYI